LKNGKEQKLQSIVQENVFKIAKQSNPIFTDRFKNKVIADLNRDEKLILARELLMNNARSKLNQKFMKIQMLPSKEGLMQKVFESDDISEEEFDDGEESIRDIDVNHIHVSKGGSKNSADFSSFDLKSHGSSSSSSLNDEVE